MNMGKPQIVAYQPRGDGDYTSVLIRMPHDGVLVPVVVHIKHGVLPQPEAESVGVWRWRYDEGWRFIVSK